MIKEELIALSKGKLMRKYFISSHGKLASGFKSSIEILLGQSNNVTVFDAYLDETNFEDVIKAYLENQCEDDQIILMSDLFGGSVNQVMSLYAQKENIVLVAGVNLAFVLELVATGEHHLTLDQIDELIIDSRNALCRVELNELKEPDEFF